MVAENEIVFGFTLSREEVEEMLQQRGIDLYPEDFYGLDEILYDRAWTWVCDNIDKEGR